MPKNNLTIADWLTIVKEIIGAVTMALDNGGTYETPVDFDALKINKSADEVLGELQRQQGKK